MFRSRRLLILVFIVTLSSSFGFALAKIISPQPADVKSAQESGGYENRLGGFKFINPLLECNVDQSIGGREYKQLEKKLTDFLEESKRLGQISDASVYFRSLNNGPWFGVNEKADFSPASLLKLPVMMAYYKEAEHDLSLLNEDILFDGDGIVLEQNITSGRTLEKGKMYSVEDLISYMITDSDNSSLELLEKRMGEKKINQVTYDLGITTAVETTPEDYMSVKEYSALFRVLYNASYLNHVYSEKALSILSKSTFNQGLVSGIPREVKVAHKMGERELQNGIRQLHDCGIIYLESHPYLLCIMTRGYDFEKLSKIISMISSQVYSEMTKE